MRRLRGVRHVHLQARADAALQPANGVVARALGARVEGGGEVDHAALADARRQQLERQLRCGARARSRARRAGSRERAPAPPAGRPWRGLLNLQAAHRCARRHNERTWLPRTFSDRGAYQLRAPRRHLRFLRLDLDGMRRRHVLGLPRHVFSLLVRLEAAKARRSSRRRG